MNRSLTLILAWTALTMSVALVKTSEAATVTPQVLINFDGTLSGTAYTLGPGELDNSFTFAANGGATVSGGVADIPGDVNHESGFYFDAGITGLGLTLTTTSWISEAVVTLDTAGSLQPNDPNTTGGAGKVGNNHILDVQGDTFYRVNGEDTLNPKFAEFGYWDGSNEQKVTTPDFAANAPYHVALVWDATATTLSAYQNGNLRGTIDLSAFDTPSPYVGYGWFARHVVSPGNSNIGGRSIDGKLDAIAFSTYTGTFDAGADFQLPAVPEPASVVMLLSGLALVFSSRRVR
jgi:hypothetical protein